MLASTRSFFFFATAITPSINEKEFHAYVNAPIPSCKMPLFGETIAAEGEMKKVDRRRERVARGKKAKEEDEAKANPEKGAA